MTKEEKRHWRIFSVGERVPIGGTEMIIVNITKERLILRPLRLSERNG